MASNREKLILTAAGLFMQQGYHGTGIEDILEQSGVARSNFYYHFPGKVDLAVAVTDHWIEDYNANLVRPALDSDGSISQRLSRLYSIAAQTQGSDGGLRGCPLGQLSNELASSIPAVRERLDAYFSGLIERVLVLMERHLTCQDSQLRSYAVAAVANLEGGLMLSGLQHDPRPMQEAGKGLVALIKNLE